MSITAKVIVDRRSESGEGDNAQVSVGFIPDYAEGANKEWSLYTPSLNLTMTLKGSVADKFQLHKKFTLVFEDND